MKIKETDVTKVMYTPECSYAFDKRNGTMMTWGRTPDENATHSPVGPLIADIELSTICHGIKNAGPCKFCYKSNNANGDSMTLDTFKKLLAKFPKTKDGKFALTQIAFGIGDLDSNRDLWDIMAYTRKMGIIPNITINGDRLNGNTALKLKKLCGAVAISCYDKDLCYNAVNLLTSVGMKQVNIHKLLALETINECHEILYDTKVDPRLASLNAVVFLWLKPKGKRNTLTPIKNKAMYKELVDKALDNNLNVGFDSCSATSFLKVVKDRPNYKELETMTEPCESCCFSIYINVKGEVYPCSFCEDEKGYPGINLLESTDMETVWKSPNITKFREANIKGCGKCQPFKIGV